MATEDLMLIVDDSKLARMMIRGFVKEALPEMEILEATNGEEALECSKGKDITLMTIDFNMPGIDGIELAKQLKDSCPGARMTLLTANIQDTIRQRTQEIGIDFISKPINEEKIVKFLKAG